MITNALDGCGCMFSAPIGFGGIWVDAMMLNWVGPARVGSVSVLKGFGSVGGCGIGALVVWYALS